MSDQTPSTALVPVPIEVNAAPETAQWEALVRQVILIASTAATALGYTVVGGKIGMLMVIAGPLAGLIVLIIGQLHTRRAEQDKIAMAAALPDSVAKVKGQ